MRYVTSVERVATERGLQQGLQQETSAILKRQLTKRFGRLAEETVSRINYASLEQIETWAERVLDAKTLDDVFGEP